MSYKDDFVKLLNWNEIDDLTPHYKNMIESNLSSLERKVLVSICREVADGEISSKIIPKASRIFQVNHIHTILGRLIKKDFIKRVRRSIYVVKDKKLVAHILVRTCCVKPTQ